jgi:hypothetical protein
MPRGKSKSDNAGAAANGSGKVNQMDAVRQAMGVLGMKASTRDIQAHIKEQLGFEMSPNLISNYKSSIRKKEGLPSLRGRRKKRRRAVEAAPTPQPSGEGISIKDLRALKELASRLGPGRFREVVEFFCP